VVEFSISSTIQYCAKSKTARFRGSDEYNLERRCRGRATCQFMDPMNDRLEAFSDGYGDGWSWPTAADHQVRRKRQLENQAHPRVATYGLGCELTQSATSSPSSAPA
jgi:hypothetical protein